jgi:hypothetical protein
MQSVKFIELFQKPTSGAKWGLREVMVNPEFVVCMRPDERAPVLLSEGKLPEGLAESTQFTKVQMSRGTGGIDLTVVGDVITVQKLMSIKKILKG